MMLGLSPVRCKFATTTRFVISPPPARESAEMKIFLEPNWNLIGMGGIQSWKLSGKRLGKLRLRWHLSSQQCFCLASGHRAPHQQWMCNAHSKEHCIYFGSRSLKQNEWTIIQSKGCQISCNICRRLFIINKIQRWKKISNPATTPFYINYTLNM